VLVGMGGGRPVGGGGMGMPVGAGGVAWEAVKEEEGGVRGEGGRPASLSLPLPPGAEPRGRCISPVCGVCGVCARVMQVMEVPLIDSISRVESSRVDGWMASTPEV
jgi:hypothetical protein